jgi:predicted lipid-binding transport protein (Tim44 family)
MIDAELRDRNAFVTMKFVTEQINVTRNKTGDVIEGDPSQTSEVTDIWTFGRNTQSRDPNWMLVETRSPT